MLTVHHLEREIIGRRKTRCGRKQMNEEMWIRTRLNTAQTADLETTKEKLWAAMLLFKSSNENGAIK